MSKLKAGDPNFPLKVQQFAEEWNRRWSWYYDLEHKGKEYIDELLSSPYLSYVEGVSIRGEEIISLRDISYNRSKYHLKSIRVKGG